MSKPIVVFDGECALCNGFVAWLIRHDTRVVFLIAGSAGAVGQSIVDAAGLDEGVVRSSIVVWDGSRGLLRSDAVIAIARELGWPWRAARAGRLIPRGWRDAAYASVARRRARLVAEDAACGVPPTDLVSAWRARLATMADVPAR